jgi:microcystin-dependent protein
MAIQTINIGAAANDSTGDTPRVAGAKINANFTELYGAVLNTQTAKTFLSAPVGSSGIPSFRTITLSDLPVSGASTGQAIVYNGSTLAYGTILTVPIGTILDYISSTAPSNFAICNGHALSRSIYVDLFNIIGTTFGVGDGSTTFNLPDLRGRVSVGHDPTNTVLTSASTNGANAATIGGVGGAQTHTLTTAQIPAHSHSGQVGAGTGAFLGDWFQKRTDSTNATSAHAPAETGGGTAHSNTQPWIALPKIIRII